MFRHDVIANQDIQEGEELTISYLEKCSSIEEQHALLKKKYLFDCGCTINVT
jgi:hypothetical protein